MAPSNYHEQLQLFHYKIRQLPTSDLKYPLYLLWLALHKHGASNQAHNILDAAIAFIDSLQAFLDAHSAQQSELLSLAEFLALQQQFKTLIDISGTNTTNVHLRQAALNLAGTVAAIGGSIVGGFIGGISGFVRGLWNMDQGFSLEYTWTGVLAGGFLGAALGFRVPKKMCKDPAFRQLKFANDALSHAFNRTRQGHDPALNSYKEKAYALLLAQYFDGRKARLDAFLATEQVSYDIVTKNNQFISPKLEGFLGHHSSIRIPIGDRYFAIELTDAPSDCTVTPMQSETRIVSGQKILDMIALHLLFRETDSLNFLITKFKAGENDCFRRINDVLIGTNQSPTRLRRFPLSDNSISRSIGFFINELSAYPAQPLEENVNSSLEMKQPTISKS
jgi:hypothetical protein